MSHTKAAEVGEALRLSFPVFLGYLAIGFGFGLLSHTAGLPWYVALFMSLFVYAGALQYLGLGLLTAHAGLAEIALVSLAVNARHSLYGLAMLESFRGSGNKKAYLIFSLTDETYALLSSLRVPPGLHPHRLRFFIGLFDQAYWVAGSLVGALAGSLFVFPTEGMDFALSALFLVLLLDQWKLKKDKFPFFLALGACLLSILLFGSSAMLLPALLVGIAVLMLLPLLKKDGRADGEKDSR